MSVYQIGGESSGRIPVTVCTGWLGSVRALGLGGICYYTNRFGRVLGVLLLEDIAYQESRYTTCTSEKRAQSKKKLTFGIDPKSDNTSRQ